MGISGVSGPSDPEYQSKQNQLQDEVWRLDGAVQDYALSDAGYKEQDAICASIAKIESLVKYSTLPINFRENITRLLEMAKNYASEDPGKPLPDPWDAAIDAVRRDMVQ